MEERGEQDVQKLGSINRDVVMVHVLCANKYFRQVNMDSLVGSLRGWVAKRRKITPMPPVDVWHNYEVAHLHRVLHP